MGHHLTAVFIKLYNSCFQVERGVSVGVWQKMGRGRERPCQWKVWEAHDRGLGGWRAALCAWEPRVSLACLPISGVRVSYFAHSLSYLKPPREWDTIVRKPLQCPAGCGQWQLSNKVLGVFEGFAVLWVSLLEVDYLVCVNPDSSKSDVLGFFFTK